MTIEDSEESAPDSMSISADGTVSLDYDWASSNSLSVAILEALEASTGKPPSEYGPLNDIVDVDALDNLFGPTGRDTSRGPGYVTLEIDDHTVTVHSDGSVVVAPQND